jgi:hypothetical protein
VGFWFADFEQLRRSKKHHSRGIVKKRIYQTALVNNDDAKPKFLSLDTAGQASGTGSDHQNVGVHLGMRTSLDLRQRFNIFGGEEVWHGVP